MESEDEDEYRYDSRTPVGKLLKRVEKLLKKPALDDQLSELLDKFTCYFLEQQEYLNNGLCQVNFSETALFIQACSKVFVKKVDVYWDQVLSFHARLIEYDVEHARKTGAKVDRSQIERLEERRNRNKRKKKYKVVETSNEWLAEIYNQKHDRNELMEPCEADQNCLKIWEELYRASEKYRGYHPLVREQQLKSIKFDRKVAKRDDFDVYDMNGEFIMKYSKMPGWRDVYDLIEYNNEGLLPDKDNIISGLKLRYFGRIEYFRDNCIPFDAPYEEYGDGWEKYKLRFFELESRKWQNRPLDTLEDLKRQYEYLAEMANDDEPEIVLPCNSIPLPKVMDVNMTESSQVVNSNDNSPDLDLFVVLDRLPADQIKSRQDSGYYEEVPEDNAMDDEESEISTLNIPNVDSSLNPITNDVSQESQQSNLNSDCGTYLGDHNYHVSQESQQSNVNSDCGTYLGDHSYSKIPVNISPLSDNKGNEEKIVNTTTTEVVVPFQNLAQIIPRARETLKRKLTKALKEPAPPKTRKLSKREIEKLSRSIINPVKELKFEKFFSVNYHPQTGEGEIQPVDYESEEECDDIPEPFDAEEDKSQDCPESSGCPNAVPVDPESSTIEQNCQNDSGVIDTCESTPNKSAIESVCPSQPESMTQKELEMQKMRKYFADSRKELGIDESREDALLEEQKASIARVEAWKEHIRPIINNLKETDFDIHEYGSKIMDGMRINEEKPFKDMVKGKSSAEVVRLFISSLQLASTSNIEICGVTPGELANDTYKVKLLKTERYHEDLEGYQAPSREVVRERRKRMKEKKQSQNSDSSDDEPLMKMRKPKRYMSGPSHDGPSTSYSSLFNIPGGRGRSSCSNPISSPSSHHDDEDEGFNESFSSAAGTSFNSPFSERVGCHSTPKGKTKMLRVELQHLLNFSL